MKVKTLWDLHMADGNIFQSMLRKKTMFPDSQIASEMQLKEKIAVYIIKYDILKYFDGRHHQMKSKSSF